MILTVFQALCLVHRHRVDRISLAHQLLRGVLIESRSGECAHEILLALHCFLRTDYVLAFRSNHVSGFRVQGVYISTLGRTGCIQKALFSALGSIRVQFTRLICWVLVPRLCLLLLGILAISPLLRNSPYLLDQVQTSHSRRDYHPPAKYGGIPSSPGFPGPRGY